MKMLNLFAINSLTIKILPGPKAASSDYFFFQCYQLSPTDDQYMNREKQPYDWLVMPDKSLLRLIDYLLGINFLPID